MSSIWGDDASHQRGTLFLEKADPHYVILLYCKTLLHDLLVICCRKLYQISLLTILPLFYVFEVKKAKSATQSDLMILKLSGLFQKNF